MSKDLEIAEEEVPAMGVMLPDGMNLSGFTNAEIAGGSNAMGSYVSQFPYSVRADGDKLNVWQSGVGQPIAELRKDDKVAILHYHLVYRLYQGTLNGTPRDQWTEDDKKLVAETFTTPFGPNSSRGNFDAKGYGDFLDDSDKRKSVSKRTYVYLGIPGILPKGSVAISTLGSSALSSLIAISEQAKGISVPVSNLFATVKQERKKTDFGSSYYCPVFEFAKKAGKLQPVVNNVALYRKHIKPAVDDILAAHNEQIKLVESEGQPKVVPQVVSATQPALDAGGMPMLGTATVGTSTIHEDASFNRAEPVTAGVVDKENLPF